MPRIEIRGAVAGCRAVLLLSSELFIHVTGLCALVLNAFALLRTCERRLRVQSGWSGLIWALNNLLLGAHTAAALSLVSAGRTATSAMTLGASDRVRHGMAIGFALLTLAIGWFTWHGWLSLLMVTASLLSTWAMFYWSGHRLRLTMLVVSALWMVNAWQYDSWEQMLANLLTAAAALHGAWRSGRATAALPPRTSTPHPAAGA